MLIDFQIAITNQISFDHTKFCDMGSGDNILTLQVKKYISAMLNNLIMVGTLVTIVEKSQCIFVWEPFYLLSVFLKVKCP